MTTCEELAKKYLPEGSEVTHTSEVPGRFRGETDCLVDYKEPDLRSEVADIVDCESRCADEGEFDTPEFTDCKGDCDDTIEKSITGAILFSKNTTSVNESTIPVSCSRFAMQQQYGLDNSCIDVFGKESEKLTKKLEQIGCSKMDYGWMHAHEFAKYHGEMEDEPAICYVHTQAYDKAKCRLSDVVQTIWGKKVDKAQTDLSRWR